MVDKRTVIDLLKKHTCENCHACCQTANYLDGNIACEDWISEKDAPKPIWANELGW
jgi:hypothetical protein